MDMTGHAGVYRVKFCLFPDIGEIVAILILALSWFRQDHRCLVSAIGIQKQDAIRNQSIKNARKIFTHIIPFQEQVITEVHCQYDVRQTGTCMHNILVQQLDTFYLVIIELCKVVQPAPVQNIPVQINTNSVVAVITNNPFTCRIGRTAEILTQKYCRTIAKLGPGLFNKIDFGFHILNRLLVKRMAIGRIRDGLS